MYCFERESADKPTQVKTTIKNLKCSVRMYFFFLQINDFKSTNQIHAVASSCLNCGLVCLHIPLVTKIGHMAIIEVNKGYFQWSTLDQID